MSDRDEIERLRAEVAALKANTNPLCLNAVIKRLQAEVAALKACIDRKHEVLDATIRQLRKVEAERDEARRWLCRVLANPSMVTGLDKPGEGKPRDFAAEQGWDCFRAEADANNERFRRTDGE
jgi:predicted RNase H-like nuclease (RuvC/YqgF family)